MKNLLLISLIILLTACEKGEQGDPGKNADIQTIYFSVEPIEWQVTSDYIEIIKDLPELTSEIVGTGSVTLYLKNGPEAWRALPYGYTISNIVSIFNYSFYPGHLHISYSKSDGSTNIFPGTLSFKVVTVAGQ